MVPTEIAKQKQPLLRLFLSVKSSEYLVEQGKTAAFRGETRYRSHSRTSAAKNRLNGGFNGADRET